jgi:hypothetical protein
MMLQCIQSRNFSLEPLASTGDGFSMCIYRAFMPPEGTGGSSREGDADRTHNIIFGLPET